MKIISNPIQRYLTSNKSIESKNAAIENLNNKESSQIKPSALSVKANFVPFLGKKITHRDRQSNFGELEPGHVAKKLFYEKMNSMINSELKAKDDERNLYIGLYRANKDSENPEVRDEAYEVRDMVANSSIKPLRKLSNIYKNDTLNSEFPEVFNEGLLALYEHLESAKITHEKVIPYFDIKERLKSFNANTKYPLQLPKSIIDRLHKLKKTKAMKIRELNRNLNQEDVNKLFNGAKHTQTTKNNLGNTVHIEEFEDPQKISILADDIDLEKQYAEKEAAKIILEQLNSKSINPKHRDMILFLAGLELTENGELIDVDNGDDPKQVLADKYSTTKHSIDSLLNPIRKKLREGLEKKIYSYKFEQIDEIPCEKPQKLALSTLLMDLKENKIPQDKALEIMEKIFASSVIEPQEKDMIMLRYFDGGKSFAEVAKLSGLANKSMVQKAIVKIIAKLEKSSDFTDLESLL